MSLSGFLPAVSRRALVTASAAAMFSAAFGSGLLAQGTAAPPQTPAAPAQAPAAPKEPLTFDTASPRVVIITCTTDAGQAFEAALGKAKDALAKSEKPESKAQASHWKVLKGTQGENIVFVFVIDQTSVGLSYNPFVILQNAGLPAELYASDITPLFTRVNAGLKGLLALDGSMTDMTAAAGGGTR